MVNHSLNSQVESSLPRLTEQSLKDHLNKVFFHHNKREEPMWLQVRKAEFLETKQSGRTRPNQNDQQRPRNNGHVSTFHVTLSPAPANDAFDTEVFHEQGLRFVLQMWHRHNNEDFFFDKYGQQSVLRSGTPQSNPTVNPRWNQINIYLPANNNRASDTYGILVGIPAQTVRHRRAAITLAGAIQHSLKAHLPQKLNWTEFFDHIGIRSGTFSGDLKSKQRGQVPVIYVTASSRANFEALLRSYNAFAAANRKGEILWHNNQVQIIPMPTTQSNRTTTLEAIKDIDQFFGASVRIKLRPINQEATDGDWTNLQRMEEYVALFPEYNNYDPDPQCFTLVLRKTPDTHHLNTNSIRQHPGFPENILLPTLASVAATPPRQPNNNQETPTSSSHTNRLLAFTDRLLRRKPNTANDDTPTGPTARARNSPPGSPPPTKRQANHQTTSDIDGDNDPYDDGTDWTKVASTTFHHPSPPHDGKPDSKPPARRNQYAPLAEDDHNNNNKRQHEEDNDNNMMDTDKPDEQSHSLIPPDELEEDPALDNQYSAPTGQEIQLILKYVQHNKPTRIERCANTCNRQRRLQTTPTRKTLGATLSLWFRRAAQAPPTPAPAMWTRMHNGPKGRMSNPTRQPPKHCPVPDCPWKVPTECQNPHASLKEHLVTEHAETNPTTYMTPNYCHRHGFHICQACNTPTAIFNCQGHLKQHITKKHNRTETNSKLVAKTYRHATPENEANWKASLSFLYNLELTPPPFRRTIWHKIKQPIRAEFYNIYNNVVSWIIDASPTMSPTTIRDNRPPQHECDSSPFWKLLLMLEPMLLAPIKGTVHQTYSNAFKARLSMFKTGRIEELHRAIWNPTPLPPTNHHRRSTKAKQKHQQ